MTMQPGLELQLIHPDGRMTTPSITAQQDVVHAGPFVVRTQSDPLQVIAVTHHGVVRLNGREINRDQPILLRPWDTVDVDGFSLIVRGRANGASSQISSTQGGNGGMIADALPALATAQGPGVGQQIKTPATALYTAETIQNASVDQTIQLVSDPSKRYQTAKPSLQETVTWNVQLTNASIYVDSYAVEVTQEIPAAWVHVQHADPLRLYEGGTASINVYIKPPESSPAGDYKFAIIVRSDRTNTFNLVACQLTIHGDDALYVGDIDGFETELRYGQTGSFQLPLINQGNSQLDVEVSASALVDGGKDNKSRIVIVNGLNQTEGYQVFPLQYGERRTIDLEFTPAQGRFIGFSKKRYDLTVVVRPQNMNRFGEQRKQITVLERPKYHGLVPIGLLLLLLLFLIAGRLIFPPNIYEFQTDKKTYNPGEAGLLSWRTSLWPREIKIIEIDQTNNTQLAELPLSDEERQAREKAFMAAEDRSYELQMDTQLRRFSKSPAGLPTEFTATVESFVVAIPDIGINLQAIPNEVTVGDEVQLQWNAVDGATNYILRKNDVPIFETDSVLEYLDTIQEKTEYELRVEHPFRREMSATAQVNVQQIAPNIGRFDVDPTLVAPGDEVIVSWQVTGGDNNMIDIQPAIGAALPPEGNLPATIPASWPIGRPYTFTLRAVTSGDGTGIASSQATRTIAVNVAQATPIPSSTPVATPVIRLFRVDPQEVALGGSVRVDWDVSGADEIKISPEIDLVDLAASSRLLQMTTPGLQEIILQAKAIAPESEGNVEASVEVNVLAPTATATAPPTPTPTPTPTIPPPMIINFSVTGDSVQLTESTDKSATYRVDIGAEVNLSWRVQNAQEITLYENFQPRFANLSAEQVIPLRIIQETPYQLIAQTDGANPNRDDRTIILIVNEPLLPEPPTNLTVDELTKVVRWSYFSDQDLIIGFRIYRAELGSTQFDRVANESTLAATTRDWTDPDPQVCGKSYYVVAVYEDPRVDPSEVNNKRETDPTAASYNTLPCR